MATVSAATIQKNAGDISLVSAKKRASAKTNKFCEVWPTAKVGLQLLQDVIKNPVVKVIINTVIAAGDAVATKIC